ncbi:MAG: phage integrase family protein [Phycisphaera sp.]|nr:phage integrase family protein [Phycisphaera sp.]
MKTPPRRTYPPEPLTHEEVMSLLDACGHDLLGLRDRALIAVMYRAGLRISEALALHPKDIDAGLRAVRVLRGKGGRSRTVGLDAGALAIVGDWMNARRELGIVDDAPLICTRTGGAMSAGYARRLLAGLGRRAGIAKRVHPHGLRHTHAAELRAEGIDIGIISKQLGHRSIATTVRYLDHIAPWEVVEVVGGREW